MAPRTYDRVYETSSTTGTGAFTLNGAVSQYLAFSARFAAAPVGGGPETGDQIYYTIKDQAGTNWEVGQGYITNTAGVYTLNRTLVLASSNADALVSFGAGSKDVFATIPGNAFTDLTKGRLLAKSNGFDMP